MQLQFDCEKKHKHYTEVHKLQVQFKEQQKFSATKEESQTQYLEFKAKKIYYNEGDTNWKAILRSTTDEKVRGMKRNATEGDIPILAYFPYWKGGA